MTYRVGGRDGKGGHRKMLEFRDLAPGDAGWLIEQHAVHYARAEGFDASFEALLDAIRWKLVRDGAGVVV